MTPVFDSGNRALVTGGTSGIGRAIALALRDAGCATIVAGLEQGDAEPGLETRILDVTNDGAVRDLVGSLKSLDILVNAAGILFRGGAEFDLEKFRRVLDVNLTGTMRVSTACRPLLAASRGCILNVASMLSFFGGGHAPAYSSSKGGVVQLTKSLALAPGGRGAQQGHPGPHAAQALGDAPGRRGGGDLSLLAGGGLHHRHDPSR